VANKVLHYRRHDKDTLKKLRYCRSMDDRRHDSWWIFLLLRLEPVTPI